MLKLYDGTISVCAIKVRLVLNEKGIPFESHNIDLRRGDQLDPTYLALNPHGVVPTLDDDGDILIESSVIMQYLEDVYPIPSLMPKKPADRADMRLWMKRVDDTAHPSIGNLTHATVYRPGFLALNEEARAERLAKIPDAYRRARFAAVYKDGLDASIAIGSVRNLNRLIGDMEAALVDSAFLSGGSYSLADAAVTPYINRLFDMGLLGLWAVSAPGVLKWYSDIRERANFAPAIINYLTDDDRAVFNTMDPETPGRMIEILNAENGRDYPAKGRIGKTMS